MMPAQEPFADSRIADLKVEGSLLLGGTSHPVRCKATVNAANNAVGRNKGHDSRLKRDRSIVLHFTCQGRS